MRQCRRAHRGNRLKTPKRLEALVHEGMIDGVVRQLMSGKEATVYVVRCGEDLRCAIQRPMMVSDSPPWWPGAQRE